MAAKLMGWGLIAWGTVASPLLLGGCFGGSGGSVASAEPVELRAPVPGADARPPIRTVRRSSSEPEVAGSEDDPATRVAVLPTPSQIFDFHPPGSKPDTWRQPFVIDPNDGPLAGYVRRMDAELKDSDHATKTAAQVSSRKKVCPSAGPNGAISATCGENEVAKTLAR